jgi:hypothetical protein
MEIICVVGCYWSKGKVSVWRSSVSWDVTGRRIRVVYGDRLCGGMLLVEG